MKFIVNSFKTLIEIIKLLWDVISGIFETLTLAFSYLLKVVNLSLAVISTLPDWLKAFATITLAISIIYFIIGRNAGKSGD